MVFFHLFANVIREKSLGDSIDEQLLTLAGVSGSTNCYTLFYESLPSFEKKPFS